jgi:hypothetical protein
LNEKEMKMKKIVFLWVAFMATMGLQAQTAKTDTARFMNDCRQFVKYVERTPLNKQIVDSLAERQDMLIAQYRRIKPQLNDKQVEEYNRLKGRYARYILEYRGDKIGEGLQATGDSIAKATGRVGKAVGGFFKGVFNK